MTDARAKAKSEVLRALGMAEHLNQRAWVRRALLAFDEYYRLDPAQVPAKGRTEYDNPIRRPSPNGGLMTYGCQACWDDINGDDHEAHCHRRGP